MTNPFAARTTSLMFIGLISAAVLMETCPAAPSPDRRIVLNEVLTVVSDAPQTFPVFISKSGRYYLELYLEAPGADRYLAHDQAVTLSLSVEFTRRGKVYRAEDIDVVIEPGAINQTLLWTKTPWELPQRKEIEVKVTVYRTNAEFTEHYQAFRLQLKRKTEVGPIFVR